MSCIKVLVNFQVELRLHHWGTQSYSAHKALGKAYESLDGLIDTFTESYIGIYGRDEIKKFTSLEFSGPFKKRPEAVLDSMEDYLMEEIPKSIPAEQTSLLNIRDEMLAVVQQTKYLLTLS
jgi:hypothetical protein